MARLPCEAEAERELRYIRELIETVQLRVKGFGWERLVAELRQLSVPSGTERSEGRRLGRPHRALRVAIQGVVDALELKRSTARCNFFGP